MGRLAGADTRGVGLLHAVAITGRANPTPMRTFFTLVLSF
jgi:hypothetical protein